MAKTRNRISGWLVLAMALSGGCAGFQVGNQNLYRPDIRSVHVPAFRSSSFRRGVGELLTEAVVKEIELKTPYKVVCKADSDSILTGEIVSEQKSVLAEDNFDVPRSIGTELVTRIRWESRAGDLIRDNVVIPLPPILEISQSGYLIPEGGQSLTTAHQYAISQLAEQIVAQMEYPW